MFEEVTIIGPGLIGASLALALRSKRRDKSYKTKDEFR